MQQHFNQIFNDIVIRWEGDKVVNDPVDKGGLTKYGISQRAHPQLDIAHLSEEQAQEIYKEEYWDKMRLDEVMDFGICKQLFQQAINQGPGVAAISLQKILNMLRFVVDVDGVVGPKTLTAVNSYHTPSEIIWALKGSQYARYVAIVERSESQIKFFRGWLRRTFMS